MNHHFSPAYAIRGPLGPRVAVPFAAIDMKFSYPAAMPDVRKGRAFLEALLLPAGVAASIPTRAGGNSFVEYLQSFIEVLLGAGRFDVPPMRCIPAADLTGTIAMGFFEVNESVAVLQQAYALSCALVCGGDASVRIDRSKIQSLMAGKDVNFYLRRAAAALDIPIVELEIPQAFQCGHGRFGQILSSASTDKDSYFGFKIQGNKFLSNRLIKRAGFPGVDHAVASSESDALQAAARLGYPLVVKPLHGSNGVGATANIVSDEALREAYREASAVSPTEVLVESFVEGEEYRIFVAGGQYAGARRKLLTCVVGNGVATVTQLIEEENLRRLSSPRNRDRIIPIDEKVDKLLRQQGLGRDSVPLIGQEIGLTSAFTTELGTSQNATADVHPDTVAMAEDVAALFRLPTLGIDFICDDVRTSWAAQTCAIIEVNASPIIRSEDYAELYLRHLFREMAGVRIPATLVISDDAAFGAAVWRSRREASRWMGYTFQNTSRLNRDDVERHFRTSRGAVAALLVNPRCEAIVISRAASDIAENGLPLDRFDDCIIDRRVMIAPEMMELLRTCCGTVSLEEQANLA